jgi:hypothetical protein
MKKSTTFYCFSNFLYCILLCCILFFKRKYPDKNLACGQLQFIRFRSYESHIGWYFLSLANNHPVAPCMRACCKNSRLNLHLHLPLHERKGRMHARSFEIIFASSAAAQVPHSLTCQAACHVHLHFLHPVETKHHHHGSSSSRIVMIFMERRGMHA